MSSTNADLFGSPILVSVENQVKGLIAAAEANIERLTTQIRDLSLRRERERSILATLRLMVVPVGKLPTELLVEIFKLVVDADTTLGPTSYYFDGEVRTPLRGVLCLSQVSPYWRQIVHNTPQLWTRNLFEICVDRESKAHYLDELQTFLARSNPLPISIALALSAEDSSYVAAPKTIARIITPTIHRWKSLKVELPYFRSFNDIPSERFEALEHLSIGGFKKQTDPVVAFQFSPRLQNFTFYSEGVSKIHLLRLPWSQLVHLDLTDVSLSSAATGSLVVTLPSLERLALTFQGVATPNEIHGIEAFIAPLVLPSLKTLELDFEDDRAAFWPTQAVTSFQGRCPNIEKITLSNSSLSSEELLTLLRNGHALTTLKITLCWDCINNHFWDALQYRVSDASPLAPKLKHLDFEYVAQGFEEGAMEAAIRTRWWPYASVSDGPFPPISRLGTVWVSCFGGDFEPFSEEFKAGMQDIVDQGLDLDLS
ncbi:F-box domain-containing protein [Mycena sanguinolenta]|uniref:F-box domain-containing protein n=1 Tax=Mycena sanguinolenta TaxID=230812 RepID=A0A8H6YS56_9AGAR|nr:F-box domain-containing protein [Mycena sanguinolenta]